MIILTPGVQTSIQDQGRFGAMKYGVAVGGAMDRLSMELANRLVENESNAPVVEVTLAGPVIQFEETTSIAICGGEFGLELNGVKVEMNETHHVDAGDTLEFLSKRTGMRAYLAVAADFDFPPVLKSRSANITAAFGGTKHQIFQRNEKLKLVKVRRTKRKHKIDKNRRLYFSGNYCLRCMKGLEFEKFTSADTDRFFETSFLVHSDSNRMGLRLNSDAFEVSELEQIVSSGVVPGTIQITSSGMPIIAGVESQTIGGYPRIANVISADLPILGQLAPHDKLTFQIVTLEKAREIYQQQQSMLAEAII